MNPEFDNYAKDYSELLADPLRDKFADECFFHERKLLLIREFFRRRALDSRQHSWVDIGCGRGDLLRMGRTDFASAAGCDVSPSMLEACAGLDVRRQESPDTLPFAEGSADFVTAVCVYHHVPPSERARLTMEARRILKPRGIFCIIEHNPLNPLTQAIVRRSPVDVDARLLTAAQARRLLRQQRFRVLAIENFLFLPERLYRCAGFLENYLRWLPLGGQYAAFAEAR